MYKKTTSGWRKHLDFILIDIFCLHIALVLAYAARHGEWNLYADKNYLNIALVMIVLDVLIAIIFTSFKNVLKRGYFNEFIAALKHVSIVELSTIFYVFSIQKGIDYSRAVFYLFPVFYLLLTLIARYAWKIQLLRRRSTVGARSLLVVTTGDMAVRTIEEIKSNKYETFLLKGIVLMGEEGEVESFDESDTYSIDGVPIVTGGLNVAEEVSKEWVDAVLINLPHQIPYPVKMVQDFQMMGVVVHNVVARKNDDADISQQVERIGGYTVLTTSMNQVSGEQIFVKRAMDILGGLVGCIIAGLICLIFGPIIYKKSPGPILFTQTRVGRNGKTFKIYKLRTMYMDAEARKAELLKRNRVKDGLMFKLDYDPRIIGNEELEDGTFKKGIGSFLREYSLDEFPQFINVLKGDMSLVGTRPPTLDEWEQYELHHRARLAIKPGMTGMWQVSGRSNITDFDEVVKLDTKYIAEWNIALDIKILVKTVLVVLGKRGAM